MAMSYQEGELHHQNFDYPTWKNKAVDVLLLTTLAVPQRISMNPALGIPHTRYHQGSPLNSVFRGVKSGDLAGETWLDHDSKSVGFDQPQIRLLSRSETFLGR